MIDTSLDSHLPLSSSSLSWCWRGECESTRAEGDTWTPSCRCQCRCGSVSPSSAELALLLLPQSLSAPPPREKIKWRVDTVVTCGHRSDMLTLHCQNIRIWTLKWHEDIKVHGRCRDILSLATLQGRLLCVVIHYKWPFLVFTAINSKALTLVRPVFPIVDVMVWGKTWHITHCIALTPLLARVNVGKLWVMVRLVVQTASRLRSSQLQAWRLQVLPAL